MKKTTNYQLNQWEPTDRVKRADFNADNAAIDAAIAGKSTVYAGYYTGNGENTQFINLGRTPKAVFVLQNGYRLHQESYSYGGLAITRRGGGPIDLTDGGFTARGRGNENTTIYHYLAFF